MKLQFFPRLFSCKLGATNLRFAGFFVGLIITYATLCSSNLAKAEESNRIVAIGGSITEIVFALGEEDRLIARDSTSIYPREAFKLPDVGYIRRLSPEGVLSVEPDLILALEGSGPPEALDALKEAKVPLTMIPEGYTADKVKEKILAVAAALGVKEKGDKLAAEMHEKILNASEAAHHQSMKTKVMFLLSLQGGKILTAGAQTSADAIITLSGAENAITGLHGFKQVSDEAVISANPDVLLMMNRRGDHGASDEDVLAHPAIAATTAGANKKLIRLDGMFLLGFGPRTADAIEALHSELY